MSKVPTLLTVGSLRLGVNSTPSNEVPIQYITSWIKRKMPEFGGLSSTLENRILIIRAETGSGKSTILPVAIFRILRSESTAIGKQYRGAGVICTQPRVLTAMALAKDVSSRPWNPDIVLGTTVGYQTGPVSNKPRSGLTYSTAGVLAVQLRTLSDNEIMDKYRFIIIDEAHERALDNDMVLMSLRNFYFRNIGNIKLPFLLLASATFDVHKYSKYFNVGADNIMEVIGRAYPIDIHWPTMGTNNYALEAARTAIQIHEEHQDDNPLQSDILIFMPGSPESMSVAKELVKYMERMDEKSNLEPFLVLIINREVVISQIGDYLLLFEERDKLKRINGKLPLRRIVISTIVAETGLTIDTLKYVIDCGWNRTQEVYPPWGAEGLITRPAPQSRIQQRKGRAGRLFPGEFYPLYTESVFNSLELQQIPDIISNGSMNIHLAIIAEQQKQKIRLNQVPEFRVEDIALLEPPPVDTFLYANSIAIGLGFVSPRAPLPTTWPPSEVTNAVIESEVKGPLTLARGYGLTTLGHIGAMFSRTPMTGVGVLMAGLVWGASLLDLVTGVAMFGISVQDLYIRRPKTAPPNLLPAGAEALKLSLPPYMSHRLGGGEQVMPPLETETFYYRTKLLISDDFIEAIMIFDTFMQRLDIAAGDLAVIMKWCKQVELKFDTLMDIARKRENIIEEMMVAGMNPFKNSELRLVSLPMDKFTEGVKTVKRCIYEGLKHNLLQWNDQYNCYLSIQGLKVRTPPLFMDHLQQRMRALHVMKNMTSVLTPKWIITDQIRLMPAPKREDDIAAYLVYVADTNLVSVLDGYITPDPDFNSVRSL